MQVFTALLLLLFTEENPCPGRRKIICITYDVFKKIQNGPDGPSLSKGSRGFGIEPVVPHLKIHRRLRDQPR